jgi:hypothetical protein
LFRSHEANQRTEARGLEKRHKGKSKCVDKDRDKSENRGENEGENEDKAKMRMEAEWVPSIYLAVIK